MIWTDTVGSKWLDTLLLSCYYYAMKHLDLFSGIGGFALACSWAGVETIGFCEIDGFCCKVLNKHWPNVPICKDVNNVEEIKVIANATSRKPRQSPEQERRQDISRGDSLILTAGFPCQPFSNAGRKRGSSDDRYLWPQTIAVIEAIKPDWIILENVPGILNMVFPDSEVRVASQSTLFGVENDEICDYSTISGGIERDLRQAGYETVWLVIPACGLGAPHRRDRVWIVAQSVRAGTRSVNGAVTDERWTTCKDWRTGVRQENGQVGTSWIDSTDKNVGIPNVKRLQEQIIGRLDNKSQQPDCFIANSDRTGNRTSPNRINIDRQEEIERWAKFTQHGISRYSIPRWEEDWYEVATRFCRMDARVPDRVDRLKSLGNAIVPQVAYQIIRTIQEIEQ